ncbi:hypothetical protein [Bartonella gabonensis]|uniref:hypothetical protein n=1 Tax=Bartonella gabonensis TaxID=2699889 RepID=UPI00158F634A|nr:hypothetical protein [Bartonella gabonensis]
MLSPLQRLLTIVFLLLTLIYSVKNSYAEFNLPKLSLSDLTLEEKYKRIKERIQAIEKRRKFIETKFPDLMLSQIRIYNIEHDKLIQERKELIDEGLHLSFELRDLAKEKEKLAYETHKAKEYKIGEYEKKVGKVKEYLKSRRAYELGLSSDAEDMEIFNDRAIDRVIKEYPTFILSCKIQESILYSDVGTLLQRDFGWKQEDFSWAKDAVNSIDPELIKYFEEMMLVSVSDYEKKIINGIKDMMTVDSSAVKSAPLFCKTIRKIHNIMLPEKRKNIMSHMESYVE